MPRFCFMWEAGARAERLGACVKHAQRQHPNGRGLGGEGSGPNDNILGETGMIQCRREWPA